MMRCTKAIIPVAGYGTRRLPVTKAIEKCMLPVLNRPVVDYVVADCVAVGIKEIIFVVNKHGHKQLKDYYSENVELEAYLKRQQKAQLINTIRSSGSVPHESISFRYVEQPDNPYGTTVPLSVSRQYIADDELVLVIMGDQFIYNPTGELSDTDQLLRAATSGSCSAISGVEVAPGRLSHYGVIEQDVSGRFIGVVEKPKANPPSNLINVSKYVFTPDFWPYIDSAMRAKPNESNEYFLTDPINSYVNDGHRLQVVPVTGTYLDCGTLDGWLDANNYLYTKPH